MTDQHPITPPLEMLKQWEDDWFEEREHADVLLIQAFQAGADRQLEQVFQVWEQCVEEPETDIQVIRLFDQKLKAMRPTTQEDLEDVQLVLERMNSIPEPITLEELMTLDDTTQENN